MRKPTGGRHKAGVTALFDRLAEEWPALYERDPVFRQRSDLLVDAIARGARPGDLLVDVGCGAADVGRRLAERGLRVVGIDASLGMLRIARSATDGSLPVHRALADAARLPLPDDCARFVLCSSVLEYIDEEDPAFDEIRRILRSGGRAWITLPRRRGAGRWFRQAAYSVLALRRRLRGSDPAPLDLHRLRRRLYDRGSIEARARRSGLALVELRIFGLPRPLARLPAPAVRWLEGRPSAAMMLLAVLEPAPGSDRPSHEPI